MDFFDKYSWLVLFGLAFFPRLTLLLSSIPFGGALWWLGWFIAPHLLVAILAIPYWDTNPALVIMAWIFALSGTSTEGSVATKRTRN